MPCTDGGVPYPPSPEELLDAKAPAMLCAILRVVEREWGGINTSRIISEIDWANAGVTQAELNAWWKAHKKRDRKRAK